MTKKLEKKLNWICILKYVYETKQHNDQIDGLFFIAFDHNNNLHPDKLLAASLSLMLQ